MEHTLLLLLALSCFGEGASLVMQTIFSHINHLLFWIISWAGYISANFSNAFLEAFSVDLTRKRWDIQALSHP
jgi:hypothetical protein